MQKMEWNVLEIRDGRWKLKNAVWCPDPRNSNIYLRLGQEAWYVVVLLKKNRVE